MSDKLKLDIVTPSGQIFSDEVDEVTASGSEGEFGVMPAHAPFITTLKSGLLIAKQDGVSLYFFVSWGYAEVGPDKVVILADSAEKLDDIDLERASDARARAEEWLKKKEHCDSARAEASLERAAARITAVKSFGGR